MACAVALASVCASAQQSSGATRDAARTLGMAGVEAFQQGSYETASDNLEKAYALLKVPSIGLWSARALAKRDHLLEAADRYLEVTSLQIPVGDTQVQRKAQADAQAEVDALRPQIPRLVVIVHGADSSELSFSIDTKELPASALGGPRLVNPGKHRVVVRRAAEERSAEATVALGGEKTVELYFGSPVAKSPIAGGLTPVVATRQAGEQQPAVDQSSRGPAAASSQRTFGWVALSAGAVGLAVGGVTGVIALSKHSSIVDSDACVGSRCPPSKQSQVDSLGTMRTVSSVGFIAGGALAATGIVLLLSAPAKPSVSASLSFDGVRIGGRF